MQVDETLEPFERLVLEEVRQWVNRDPGWMDRAMGGESSRSRQLLELVLDTESGRKGLEAATDGAIAALKGTVLRNLEVPEGPVPTEPKEREAALRHADQHAEDLRRKYVAALGAQGALAGVASLTPTASAVILVGDVTLAVGLTLRAAAHHLAVYGALPSHRFAMEASVELVALATETDPPVRKRKIGAISRHLAEPPPFSDLSDELPRLVVQQLSSRGLKEAVEQIVRRVLRRRLTALVPMVGAAAGGAASAWLAKQACEASRQLGRLAFLMRQAQLPLDDVLRFKEPLERVPDVVAES
ncbi:MAG: EcsC family protein [Nitriliruptorales bacterium]